MQLTVKTAKRAPRFAMTDMAMHEAWVRIHKLSPAASLLAHVMVTRMDRNNALVISHKTLAELMDSSVNTVKRALAVLEDEKWIQSVELTGKGSVKAYFVHTGVAWTQDRNNMPRLANFTATVVASEADQTRVIESGEALQPLPMLDADEIQLPSGAGEPPPSQPTFAGMLPDIPARRVKTKGGDQVTITAVGEIID